MKKIFALALIVSSLFACEKWDGNKNKHGEKDNLTYYSEDYKDMDFSVLGVHSSDMDALWVEFYSKNEKDVYDSYTLIVKSDGEFTKQVGTCDIDWYSSIAFSPETEEGYTGTWVSSKEKFTLSAEEEDRSETITFIYKAVEKKKCGFGKG